MKNKRKQVDALGPKCHGIQLSLVLESGTDFRVGVRNMELFFMSEINSIIKMKIP